MDCGLFIALV